MQVAVIILDGWGIGDATSRDAVKAASTPNFDAAWKAGATGTLRTSGRTVGLPDGQAGNSEVGHLALGAGRVINQPFTRINDAIDENTLRDNQALQRAFEAIDGTGGTLHLLGLVSDGGVHSSDRHLHALIEWAGERGIPAVTHAFSDGRDTAPTGGEAYLSTLQEVTDRAGTGDVASVIGRYFAMDRDENWERTKRAYDAIVDRKAPHKASSGVAAVEAAYARGETDEFIEPTIIAGQPGIQQGDAAIVFNFRGDRARQLVRLLAGIDETPPVPVEPPAIELVTMTEYDETFDLPVAFPPALPEETLGEVLSDRGYRQLRLAETEKYAHVTYFLNGGQEQPFPGEVREIVPSPDVPTYDLQPEMSAPELTDRAIALIGSEEPDVLVLNFANPDMVGHTGDFEAAVTAVEAVDTQLGRLLERLERAGAHVIVTADHGNADDMGTPEQPHTAHTKNPVPVIYLSPAGTDGGRTLRAEATLPDVAPTVLALLGETPPSVMTGTTLFDHSPDHNP